MPNKPNASKRAKKKSPTKEELLTANNSMRQAFHALSALAMRSSIASRLGKSFDDDRDIYTALGYNTVPEFKDYMAKYRRNEVAKTVIDAPVDKSWQELPTLSESEDEETEFENAWCNLVEKKQVYHYLNRVDKLACIGQYGVLVLGFDDNTEMKQPVTRAHELLYMMPYSQDNVNIKAYEIDPKSERYGKPVLYEVISKAYNASGVDQSKSIEVHHSRVIHITPQPLEDDNFGRSVLESIYNRLQNLELVVGGSAEMFWRGAFPGYVAKLDEGHTFGHQSESDLEKELEEWVHDFKRTLRIQGVSIEAIQQQIADPRGQVDVMIDMICIATRIPKRILLGSERGELASSQDESNWIKTIISRRNKHCEPMILRPFVDRLIEVGVLPQPTDGYTITWPDPFAPSDEQKAELGAKRAKSLKDYVDSLGGENILPPELALKYLLGLNDETIETAISMVGEILTSAESEEEEAEETEEQ